MSNTIEYLVKYSVAPPPSRDYYGLKVLQDEVILYLWKISHGPHKAPVVHRVKFVEFGQDKTLHDKICHGFGEHLLEHVRNITEGNRNTLLTLPLSLIEKISKYLSFGDIANLSLLSRVSYEIFNNNSIWQTLYDRDKTARISLEEKERAKVYGWKQLYKIRQMSIKGQKNSRIQSSMKSGNDTRTTKSSLKLTTSASKSAAKTTITAMKKRPESSDLVTIPLSKTISSTRFGATTVDEKSVLQKKPVRNANSLNAQKKNAQKDLVASKTMTKPDKKKTKSTSKYSEVSDRQQFKSEKYANKIDNVIKMQKDKSKSVASKVSPSKSSTENIKVFSSSLQNSRKKSLRSKTKTKSDKVAATNSEIFNTDKDLSDNSFTVKNDDFELADLIEASLKNIRSPRSIFDSDFSYVQQPDSTKNASRVKNVIQSIDQIKYPKNIRNDVPSSNFYNKMIRGDRILDKLSEKSEPFSASSSESLANDKNSLPSGDNKPVKLSEKFLKAQAELRDVLDWRRSDPAPSENRWDLPSFWNKSFSPRKIDRVIDEKFPIVKGPLRNVSLLNAYASNSLESREDNPRKDTKVVLKNQISSTKLAEDIE